jgi:hypothetical protein
MFFISGTAYILAWVIMQALLGKKEEVVFN